MRSSRSGWRKGSWLVVDEESGFTRYSDDVVARDGYGKLVTRRYSDPRHPQEFVKPLHDPRPIPFARRESIEFDICPPQQAVVGLTTIHTINGPAMQQFQFGIGDAEIGCTFVVY